jgi:DNA-binding response OmpR family regulator
MTERSPAADAAPLRLAVIDTDSGFLQVLTKRLERLAWEHRVLASAVPIDTVVAMRLNAIVVDLSVLGPPAWEYLEKLCAALPGLGVVVCTGQSTVAQRVRGLRLGADDWLTKPCHPEELIARIEAVVRRRRRAEARSSGDPITAGEIEIRSDRFQAFVRQGSIDLTRREFELIELLAGAEGRVLEREEIYQRVWGYAMARGDRSVDVFVRKLRQKLEKASPDWRYIHTHFGVGYRFSPEPEVGEVTVAEPVLPAPLTSPEPSASSEAAASSEHVAVP